MSLDPATIKHYRKLGHDLRPIVTISDKGFSEGVAAELARALDDHELVKIKLAINDRDQRSDTLALACKESGSELIQAIGKVALLYKKSSQETPKHSKAR